MNQEDCLLNIEKANRDPIDYWHENNICYRCGESIVEFNPWETFGPDGIHTYPICEKCLSDEGEIKNKEVEK